MSVHVHSNTAEHKKLCAVSEFLFLDAIYN